MPAIEPRVYTYYKSVVCQDILYARNLKNIMEFPKITECVLNSSSATLAQEKEGGLAAQIACSSISGQRSAVTRARKSIATFQLRRGSVLGCAVNVRGAALHSFLDQYITIACSPLWARDQAAPAQAAGERQRGAGAEAGRLSMPMRRCRQRADHNFGGGRFTPFPGLETHFLAFSTAGGFNCTLSAVAANYKEFTLLLTALQFPIPSP